MGVKRKGISTAVRRWIERQQMFFVATAASGPGGSVNLSPKGLDSLRVLDEWRLAYLDFGGSGIETIAHLRENGRIVIMMCAFDGPPKIYRFHGQGSVVMPGDAQFDALAALFADRQVGIRSIIVVDVQRVSDSCGFGVPLYEFVGQRATPVEYLQRNGVQHVREYLGRMNATSIDGLPGLTPQEAAAFVPPEEPGE